MTSHSPGWIGFIALAQVCLFLSTACSVQGFVQPDVIHERPHSGGSVVAFNSTGDLLASGGWEGSVRLWRMPDGTQVQHFRAHKGSVNGIVFADTAMVTAGYDAQLVKWALDGSVLERRATPSPVMHMAGDAGMDRIVTGHRDGSVRMWRLSDLQLLDDKKLHRGAVRALAIDPVARRFASGGKDGEVYLWPEVGAARGLQPPPTDARTLVFTPDGKWLYGGGWFRLARWDLRDGSLRTLPTPHYGIIKALQFTPGGGELASISRQTDSAVYFLDPATGRATRRFQKHDLCGASIAVSPGGHFLATTSDDASVRIWRLEGKGE